MSEGMIIAIVDRALLTVLIVSGPALAAAVIVGLAVGTLQALTQIQDQTLAQAVKLVAVALLAVTLGPLLASFIGEQATVLFTNFAAMTR
jgi:type III secretion protein S